jgi:hypothetical protein
MTNNTEAIVNELREPSVQVFVLKALTSNRMIEPRYGGINIETLKTLLIKQIAKACDVHLPYYRENRPEQYSNRLFEAQRNMQALVNLESLTQAEIDVTPLDNLNGLTIVATVERILELVKMSKLKANETARLYQ